MMAKRISSGGRYFHRRRRRPALLMGILLALAVVLALAAVVLLPLYPVGEDTRSASSALPVSSAPAESSTPAEPSAPAVSSEASEAPDTSASVSSEDALAEDKSPEVETQLASASVPYDYTKPVPESEPVEDSYFDTAVFVGNSRTQGFVLYSGLANLQSYTDRGLTVATAETKPLIDLGDGNQLTVQQALEKGSYQSVYMMFGINELGWSYPDVFIQKYGELVDTVRQSHPDAAVYLQSILPVSQQVADTHDYINNQLIQSFNERIQQLAADRQVYYLDVASAVADETGALPADASADGIHLKKPGCQQWLAYLKTHVAPALSEDVSQQDSSVMVSSETPAAESGAASQDPA